MLPSEEKLVAQYRAAIEDVTPLVRRKAASSGFKRWLAGIQKRIYRVFPRKGFVRRNDADQLLFQVPEKDGLDKKK